MSESVRAGVDRARAVNPAIGDWPFFPAPRATTAAARGEIPKAWTVTTRGSCSSALNRSRSWRRLKQVDEATMLAVIGEPTKLRDVKATKAETA
jgi:hypothetical protein